MKDELPWWVEGAAVNQLLETLAIFVFLAGIRLEEEVDNTDGFYLREQLWFDGNGLGINVAEGKMIRKAAK